MDISVIVPAYNEEDRIVDTIAGIRKSKYINNIIVIDDGSQDDTRKVVQNLDVDLISLNKNMGKGYALKCGINKALKSSKIIIFLDADLGKSANEVDKLISPVVNNECDVTVARFRSASRKGGFGLVKLLSKKGVKYFTKQEVNCSLSGQRAFKSDVLRAIKDIPDTYGVEIGMIIDILNSGYSVKEVDVNMTHKETGRDLKGFLHRGKQFYQILNTLVIKKLRVII